MGNQIQRIKGCVLAVIIFSLLSACGGGGGEGSNSVVAPTNAASPSLTLDTKIFRFNWSDVAGATFYRLLENPDGLSGYAQVGSDTASGVGTVDLTIPLHKRINASYVLQSCNSAGCIDSSPLTISGTLIDAIGYFKASNPDNADGFGGEVSISGDGLTMAVSALGESSSTSGINSTPDNLADRTGAVYIFVSTASGWSQQAYIKASNPGDGDSFGSSMSLSEDGNTLAVGASQEDSGSTGINSTADESAENAGAVYVYSRSGTSWSQQAYIKASNAGPLDYFGSSLSLSGDGNRLAVAAFGEEGAAYLFERNGVSWAEQIHITSSNSNFSGAEGTSVSLSSDGQTLAVGDHGESSSTRGINTTPDTLAAGSGAVYLFEYQGSSWTQQAYIKASNGEVGDEFGRELALSADGNTLVVSAREEDGEIGGINVTPVDHSEAASGAVYVFSRSGSTWSEQAYIKASNPSSLDRFGWSISVSDDGNTLAVGAYWEGSSTLGLNTTPDDLLATTGAAYVYLRDGSSWREEAYIKPANNNDGSAQVTMLFGDSICLSGDGNTLAVGARGENSSTSGINPLPDLMGVVVGAVYLY